MRTQEALDLLEGGERRRPTMDGSRAEGEGSGTEAAGNVTPETQSAGSPWPTSEVTSWVSPHHQKNKEEK
ncbi:Uncharacterised protein [Mycobacteroides abscessus subsp. abscessus]|uniref:hypothetical protein n=1 Tax=Mycobacteroides abscessus TaxID=36809 RepID=UPI0009259C2E|nr:hypothetical protein [Mycobacteroides abscessus]SII09657.1 Uncharacterised protein [Mycobacteroides abscessus subsp. abscessus]SLH24396.1 Uncharacterised protein [Mycobacteroides abscessus subsp. abscessus]